jgi:MSHA biogenesis protein MshP
MRSRRGPQRGFSAILALVLITLLGLIGAYMATQGAGGNIATAVSFNGMQAWFAARSGADWGALRALNGSCAASTSFSIDGYSVTVTCASASVTEPPDTYNVYSLVSTATRGANGDLTRISRTVRTFVTDAP